MRHLVFQYPVHAGKCTDIRDFVAALTLNDAAMSIAVDTSNIAICLIDDALAVASATTVAFGIKPAS